MAGARLLPVMAEGRKINEVSVASNGVLKKDARKSQALLAYRYTDGRTAALLLCCSGLVGG